MYDFEFSLLVYVCTYPVIAYCASWEEPNAITLAVSQTRVFEKQIFKLFKLQKNCVKFIFLITVYSHKGLLRSPNARRHCAMKYIKVAD